MWGVSLGCVEPTPWAKTRRKTKRRGKVKKPREEDDDDILPPSKKVKMEDKELDTTSSDNTDAIKGECSLEDILAK